MNDLIAIFKMSELTVKTRIKLIEKLGHAINFEYGSNVTDELVAELIDILQTQGDKLT